uniref:Uncharacterized protein n=1 Tax=Nelumbo nucifera TaxID=4432 RepID=A0A822ZAY9_NELNU|nr:TPA_asm: hypothetical protein HUJ06_015104 [Nelumbo nucifera]
MFPMHADLWSVNVNSAKSTCYLEREINRCDKRSIFLGPRTLFES